ncbi:MAG: ATP synthase F1 subunit epsilon [Christensenellales bacterium]|jgi:F-type H+-transporting ATPase subunit epsilon
MGEKKLHLQIITPRGIKIDQKADMLVFRALDGDMGVLPGHVATSTALGDGILRIIDEGVEQKMALFGGVAVIENDTVQILTSIAQRPEEIDLARAETDREKAEALLQERSDDLAIRSSQVLLRRSLVRIEVSVYPQDEGE